MLGIVGSVECRVVRHPEVDADVAFSTPRTRSIAAITTPNAARMSALI
jgi:hypothetical protein